MSESWKKPFQLGVKAFRESNYEEAIRQFTRSIELDNTNASVFDSRAAAYQSSSKLRDALMDTRKCISLQPDRYIGYLRSARIFSAMFKYDRCLHMLGEARQRMNPSDPSYLRKMQEITEMESSAREGVQAAEMYRRNHVDPLKKLPLELLVEICRTAVEDSDAETEPRGASHFAVVLGSVCRSLRAVVHQSPWFWQAVTFSEKRFSKKSAFWLDRLNGSPLYSVTLIDIGRQAIPRVMDVLANTCPESWKSLRIEGNDSDVHAIRAAFNAFDLSLHSFSIDSSVRAPPSSVKHEIAPEGMLAKLAPVSETQAPGTYMRRLSLHVGIIDTHFHALPQLTHLEFCPSTLISCQYNTFNHILRAAPRLRSFVVRPHHVMPHPGLLIAPPNPTLENTPPLRFEHLEVLRLGTLVPMQAVPALLFPKLEVLDLQRMSKAGVVILMNHILESPPEDRPPIREIRLNLIPADPSLFKTVLRTFTRTLESLEVSNCDVLNEDALESLSRPVESTDISLLCPRLRDINFSGTADLKAGPLIRLIKARLTSSNADNPDPPTPIRNLVIDSCPGIDASVLPWMRANVAGIFSCVYRTKAEAKGRKRDKYL